MNRLHVTWVASGLLALAVTACSSDGVPIDAISERYAEALCEQAKACPGSLGEFGLIPSLFGADADAACETLLAFIGFAWAPPEVGGVEAGTIAYDADAARRCMAELARTCTGFDGMLAITDCNAVFIGRLAIGAACQDSAECVPGSYCALSQVCGGVCTAKLGTGAPCSDTEQCQNEPGAIAGCSASTENPVEHCMQLFVEHGRGLGETCGSIDWEGDEKTYASCGPGGYCRDVGATGICAKPLEIGASCTDDDRCLNSLCDSDTNVCTGITLRANAGETCDEEASILCDGRAHLACSAGGVCEVVGDGMLGAPCATPGDDLLFSLFTCEPGLVCDFGAADPTCIEARIDGAACENRFECASGYCVDGICSPPVLCDP